MPESPVDGVEVTADGSGEVRPCSAAPSGLDVPLPSFLVTHHSDKTLNSCHAACKSTKSAMMIERTKSPVDLYCGTWHVYGIRMTEGTMPRGPLVERWASKGMCSGPNGSADRCLCIVVKFAVKYSSAVSLFRIFGFSAWPKSARIVE